MNQTSTLPLVFVPVTAISSLAVWAITRAGSELKSDLPPARIQFLSARQQSHCHLVFVHEWEVGPFFGLWPRLL